VPNPAEVLAELGRVLVSGGIAGFAEPGPEHSKTPQSQYEMKTHGVVENDIDLRALWRDAKRAGFTDLKLAIFHVAPFFLEMAQFENFLNGGNTTKKYTEAVRTFINNQRNFFLYKGEPRPKDSRYRDGLTARLSLAPGRITVNEGEPIRLHATVTNNSSLIWLPRSAGLGAVLLGCHVYRADGSVFRESYHWEALTPAAGREIMTGETVAVEVEIPTLPPGEYILEFDLVSNDVSWFAINGSEVVRVSAEVLA